ncbi:hypothetical protein [Pantoea sp. At-9b]|uniref:hypothetical protein n=1 Tax=Pantoea sp. (strain At-9b) TaxID=592316 RepID=UPI0012373573|nr:hypothetical protein [Pantoea sp. At-9b]
MTYVTKWSSTAGSFFALDAYPDFVRHCAAVALTRAEVEAIDCLAANEFFDILTEGWLMAALVEF